MKFFVLTYKQVSVKNETSF